MPYDQPNFYYKTSVVNRQGGGFREGSTLRRRPYNSHVPCGSCIFWSIIKTPLNKELFSPEQIVLLDQSIEGGNAWERKVLSTFVKGEHLTKIPGTLKKRLVILRWLVNKFELGVRDPEREINQMIKRHHPDCATLRRELIGNKLM